MHFFRSRTGLFAVGGLILVAILVGAGAVMLDRRPRADADARLPRHPRRRRPRRAPSPSPTPSRAPSPVTDAGRGVPDERQPALAIRRWPTRVPILVQIENNPIARPPSGLNLADLVIEAPVEGDTTRFAAVFMCGEQVDAAVGPVRSARYFNVDYWQQMRVRDVPLRWRRQGARPRFDSEGMPYANGLTGGWGVLLPGRAVGGAAQRLLRRRCRPRGARGRVASGPGRGRRRGARAVRVRATTPSCPSGRPVNSIGLQTSSFWTLRLGVGRGRRRGCGSTAASRTSTRSAATGSRRDTVVVQVVEQDVLIGENDPGGFPRRYQHLVGEGEGVRVHERSRP